ncbi:MAG: hypothetical protein IT308_05085 [Anaerolineaceae bacterium]|nr:hypothetical protein [Anaerolineaceae bacterium]
MSSIIYKAFPLILWIGIWTTGGWLLVRRSFNLRRNEFMLAGFGLGLVLQNWLANLIGHFLPAPLSFWLAALAVLLAGVLFWLPFSRQTPREMFDFSFSPLQTLGLLALVYVLYTSSRGLAILDDYQNLPMTSLLAVGTIPPRFALDPAITFNYHYFELLFAGQIMRIGHLQPWNSLDLARALGFSLTLMLSGLFIQRVTRSVFAAFVLILVTAFGGGTRWLMLLLPQSILQRISPSLQMIGSGYSSGPDFLTALTGPWMIEGGGPMPFPFAYMNGMNTTAILVYLAGAGALGGVISGVVALSFNRWYGWRALALTTALLAALALSNEFSYAGIAFGFILVTAFYAIRRRTRKLPNYLKNWLAAVVLAGLVVVVQGGVLTGVFTDQLAKLLPGEVSPASYFSGQFALQWPPALLSSHLGWLSFGNPYQILTALFEIGPIIVLLPLSFAAWFKSYRYGRWFETAATAYVVSTVVLAFFQYSGPAGPTALTRVQTGLVALAKGSVIWLWLWARHRSELTKLLSALLIFIYIFGGLMIFGVQLLAGPKPVLSTFISELDAKMQAQHWNRLEAGALVFDPIVYRAPTIFGRYTNSSLTWYASKPEFDQLVEAPDPATLRAAGFDYAYLDSGYWDQIGPRYQELFSNSCPRLVDEVTAKRTPEFRRLYDIRPCTQNLQ